MKNILIIVSALIAICAGRPTIVLDENPIVSNLNLINLLNAQANNDLQDKIVLKRELNDDNLNNNFFEGIFKYAKNDGSNPDSKIHLSSLMDAVENSLLRSADNVVIGNASPAQANAIRKRYIHFH